MVDSAADPLRVRPNELVFPDTFVGATRRLTVEVSNPSRIRKTIQLETREPFLGLSELTVEGGASLSIELLFRPSNAGSFRADLDIDGTVVLLSGTGLSPLSCEPALCQSAQFDAEAGRCVAEAAADGAPCSASCLADGRCIDGECRGSLSPTCNSNDACVIDSCAPSGCVHTPRECPVTDPCLAVYCDSRLGCQNRPVEDGTPCGESNCESANVCVSGRCQLRTRPDAEQVCRATAISAGAGYTCAVTRGRQLRCWGSNISGQLGRDFISLVAGPGLASQQSDVRLLDTSETTTWVADSTGVVTWLNVNRRVDLSALDALAGTGINRTVCGRSRGTVHCVRMLEPDAGRVVATDAFAALSMSNSWDTSADGELCLVRDGGARCGTPTSLRDISVLPSVQEAISIAPGVGCVRSEGTVVCWGASGLDGGTVRLWTTARQLAASGRIRPLSGKLCGLIDSGIDCFDLDETTFVAPPTRLPSVVAPQAVQVELGNDHGCYLDSDGHVSCWGANDYGQLGDRSNQPAGLVEQPFRARWMARTTWGFGTFGATDGGVFVLGSRRVNDGGTVWRIPTTAPSALSASSAQGLCELSDGGTFCHGFGPLPFIASHYVYLFYWPDGRASRGVCAATNDGAVRCFRRDLISGGLQQVPERELDAGATIVGFASYNDADFCAVRATGQVECPRFENAVRPPILSGIAELCFHGPQSCARLISGSIVCWNSSTSGTAPVAGAWPIARQLACGRQHACLLAGTNIVQCWGDNRSGQLGRDGPSSQTVVSVPIPEPVTTLAADDNTTCALLQSGRVLCWGSNEFARLGRPVLLESRIPRVVVE